MFDVSVIVPMYNAKKYIVDCINGLLNQSLENIEVIIVNDCSTDDSMELCKKHFADNKRVQLLDQPRNMGPGAARNAGIRAARGEYIAFADSDDAVRPDAYKAMYDAAKEADADVIHVTGALIQTVDDAPDNLGLLTDDELYRVTLEEGDRIDKLTILSDDVEVRLKEWLMHHIHWSIWNKLYRRSFIENNNLLFGDTKMAEDQIFCLGCLLKAGKYAKLPGEWYLYRIGGASLTRGQKQVKTLINALTTQMKITKLIDDTVKGVPYLESNKGKTDEIKTYVLNLLETSYILPACEKIGAKELYECQELKELFEDRFGDLADFALFEFLHSHDNVKDVVDVNELLNTPSFWKSRKEAEEKGA